MVQVEKNVNSSNGTLYTYLSTDHARTMRLERKTKITHQDLMLDGEVVLVIRKGGDKPPLPYSIQTRKQP